MGSLNISITEAVYKKLSQLKKEGESFSELLTRLMGEKDITKCFGLLENEKEALEQIQEEIEKSRTTGWRKIR